MWKDLGDFIATLADEAAVPLDIWPKLLAGTWAGRLGTRIPAAILNGRSTSSHPELLASLFRGLPTRYYDEQSVPQLARRKLAAMAREHLADNSLPDEAYLQLVEAFQATCPPQLSIPADSLINQPAIHRNAHALERLALGYLSFGRRDRCSEYGFLAAEQLARLPDAPDSTLRRIAASLDIRGPRFSTLLNHPSVRRSATVWASRAQAAVLPGDSLVAREATRRLLAIPVFPFDSMPGLQALAWRIAHDPTRLRTDFLAHRSIRRFPPALMTIARELPVGPLQQSVFQLLDRAVDDTTIAGKHWARALRIAGSDNPPLALIMRLLTKPLSTTAPAMLAEIVFVLQNAVTGLPATDPNREVAGRLLSQALSEWELSLRTPNVPTKFLVETLQAFRGLEPSVLPRVHPIMVALVDHPSVRSNAAAVAALSRNGDETLRRLVAASLADVH